jgi:predicted nucleic acid-binding protein
MTNGIVLDTCVLSETTKPRPSDVVTRWLGDRRAGALFVTSVTIAELCFGFERLPPGRRRSRLESWLRQLAAVEFVGRILPFDDEAALIYGRIAAQSYARGRPPDIGDAQIAATALRHGMTVATRDVAGFEPFGVPLVNPWED